MNYVKILKPLDCSWCKIMLRKNGKPDMRFKFHKLKRDMAKASGINDTLKS